MQDATAAFAEYLGERTRAVLPPDVESATRSVMIDAIGCAAAGCLTDPVRSAYRTVMALNGEGPGTVLGQREGLRMGDAAFVNTLAGRVYLFDDTQPRGFVHAGVAMTFTALAVAEELDASFGDALRAVALGVEIAARVGAAAGETQYAAGVHTTGTVAPFGAAATTAVLLELPPAKIQMALSLAGDHSAGVRQYQFDGAGANSALHAANAARSGITSAFLAREGFPAPAGMIEGRAGFLAVFRSEPNAHELLYDGFSEEWRITESCTKPYPNCRSTHSCGTAIENLMRREGLRPEDLTAIRIRVSPHAFKCDRPCPTTAIDAQFSIQYTVASLLARRRLTQAEYTDSALRDPAVHAIQRKIIVVSDQTLGKTDCRMEVDLRGGDQLVEVVGFGYIRGDPKNPMTTDEIAAKYLGNVRSSDGLSVDAADLLLATLIDGPLDTPAREVTASLASAAVINQSEEGGC